MYRAAGPFLALLLSLFAAAMPAAAQESALPKVEAYQFPEQLNIGVSTNEIAITSDFTGADLTVFGAISNADEFLLAIGAYDLTVTLEGPLRQATVRRKERAFGIWINRHSITFEPIPVSYSISSTRPLRDVAPPMALAARNIGFGNIRLMPTGAVGDGSRLNDFREALRRIKEGTGLYQRAPSGVQFISKSLFRASVRLPANVPVGLHTVRAELFRHGEFVTEQSINLLVVKTGFEQVTYNLARQQPLVYGLLAVFLALVTGWLGSVLFRKN